MHLVSSSCLVMGQPRSSACKLLFHLLDTWLFIHTYKINLSLLLLIFFGWMKLLRVYISLSRILYILLLNMFQSLDTPVLNMFSSQTSPYPSWLAYASCQFKDHEKRYLIHDLDLTAVVFALKIWRHYQADCEITLIICLQIWNIQVSIFYPEPWDERQWNTTIKILNS